MAQLFYEDVEPGTEVPVMVKNPSTRQLVQWAGASGDFYEIHYDVEFAKNAGLPGLIVHGRLKAAFLVQLLTDWIGDEGELRKFSVRYKEMDFPKQDITCKGKVTAKVARDGEYLVEGEVWTENPQGRQTTIGTFTIALPSSN